MILHRVFPWDRRADPREPGGALWFPRQLQGWGRHDNPELYGCLYVSVEPIAAVAEQLAPFRGSGDLVAGMLVRGGLPLAVAPVTLPGDAELIDLDDPAVLLAEGLRPSRVASRRRTLTQTDAAGLYQMHPVAAGLRWWSTLESLWSNVTLFDRAAAAMGLEEVRELRLDDEPVQEAARFLGL